MLRRCAPRNDERIKKPAVPQDGGLVSPELVSPLTRPRTMARFALCR
ncbi:hypothetical protein CDS [Bradyrhizobium sp.]|nr:hypothetical protein CDS [Bradyrhizobium sp.]